MKKLILACALILSLGVIGGCSKDEPSKGSNVDGNAKVDGKSINLKYGYVYYGSNYAEYSFFDRDMMKYMDSEIEELDFEVSVLEIMTDYGEISGAAIEYKFNPYEETGYIYEYEYEEEDLVDYASFSDNDRNVKCSAKSIPMNGYRFDGDNEKYLGEFNASFSVDGKVKDFADYIDDYSTRGIELTELSSDQHIFLKSLTKRLRKATVK